MFCTAGMCQSSYEKIPVSLLLGGGMWSETHINSLTLLLMGEEENLPGPKQTTINSPIEQGFFGSKEAICRGLETLKRPWDLSGGGKRQQRACQRTFCLDGMHTIPNYIFN